MNFGLRITPMFSPVRESDNISPPQLNGKLADPVLPAHVMKLSNGAVGGSCVRLEQLHASRICKLLQWGKDRYKLVIMRRKKKCVPLENLDANLTRSCARRRQPTRKPMTMRSMNPVHLLTKIRDAYVNMMNSVASSGYLDAAGMVLVDTWEFPCHTSNSMHDESYAAVKLIARPRSSSKADQSDELGAAPKLQFCSRNSSKRLDTNIDPSSMIRPMHFKRSYTPSLLHTTILE